MVRTKSFYFSVTMGWIGFDDYSLKDGRDWSLCSPFDVANFTPLLSSKIFCSKSCLILSFFSSIVLSNYSWISNIFCFTLSSSLSFSESNFYNLLIWVWESAENFLPFWSSVGVFSSITGRLKFLSFFSLSLIICFKFLIWVLYLII